MLRSLSFFLYSALTAISLLFTSCKPKLIPESDMVVILSEAFITDAVVGYSQYNYKFSRRDSIEYYQPIYQKLGYTEEQFVRTIDFYSSNQKVLEPVLDRVINYLAQKETELDTQILREKQAKRDSSNLWTGQPSWSFPQDSNRDSIHFKVLLQGLGVYTLSAEVKFLADDKTLDPSAQIWFSCDSSCVDTNSNRNRHNLKRLPYTKEGKSTTLDLWIELTDTTYAYFEGLILAHTLQDTLREMHVEVSDIHISYTPVAVKKLIPKGREAQNTLTRGRVLAKPIDMMEVEK